MRMTTDEYKAYIAKPKKKRTNFHPYKSKWELQYARQLELRRLAKDIKGWSYETVKIKLCDWQWVGKRKSGRTYTPDFVIEHNDGSVELVEVKGYQREDAMLKYQWSVVTNPQYTWRMVTYEKGNFVDLHYREGV